MGIALTIIKLEISSEHEPFEARSIRRTRMSKDYLPLRNFAFDNLQNLHLEIIRPMRFQSHSFKNNVCISFGISTSICAWRD